MKAVARAVIFWARTRRGRSLPSRTTCPRASKSARKRCAQSTSEPVGLIASLTTAVCSACRQSFPVRPSETVTADCSRRTGWLVPTVGPSIGPGSPPIAAGDDEPRPRIGHREIVGAGAGVAAVVAAAEREPEGAAGAGDGRGFLDAECGFDQRNDRSCAAEAVERLADLLRALRLRQHHTRQAGRPCSRSTSWDQNGVVLVVVRTHADAEPSQSATGARRAARTPGSTASSISSTT